MSTEASLGSETAQDVVVCAKEDNSDGWDPKLKILYTQVSTYWRLFSIIIFLQTSQENGFRIWIVNSHREKKDPTKKKRGMTKVTHRPSPFPLSTGVRFSH